jgi:hypothetical protein
MVNRNYFWGLMLTLTLLDTPRASGEVAQSLDIAPDVWGQKWEADRERGQADDLKMISRVVLLHKVKESFKVIPIEAGDLASSTYIDTPSEDAINLALETNKQTSPGKTSAPNPCLTKIEQAALCFDADGILEASDKVWMLYRASPVTGAAKLVARGPAGSLSQVSQWLTSSMNHDGIVITTKGGFILVRIPLKTMGQELQALTLENSAGKFALPKETSRGSAILSSIAIKGRYGIFKVVTGDDNPRPGTKLILEKGKKKSRPSSNTKENPEEKTSSESKPKSKSKTDDAPE